MMLVAGGQEVMVLLADWWIGSHMLLASCWTKSYIGLAGR